MQWTFLREYPESYDGTSRSIQAFSKLEDYLGICGLMCTVVIDLLMAWSLWILLSVTDSVVDSNSF
jgi:hypothetical protein